jgi:hypothetical protein
VALTSPRFRRLDTAIITVSTATVFGALVELYGGDLEGSLWVFLLFGTWQPAVLATVVRGLTRSEIPSQA